MLIYKQYKNIHKKKITLKKKNKQIDENKEVIKN